MSLKRLFLVACKTTLLLFFFQFRSVVWVFFSFAFNFVHSFCNGFIFSVNTFFSIANNKSIPLSHTTLKSQTRFNREVQDYARHTSVSNEIFDDKRVRVRRLFIRIRFDSTLNECAPARFVWVWCALVCDNTSQQRIMCDDYYCFSFLWHSNGTARILNY